VSAAALALLLAVAAVAPTSATVTEPAPAAAAPEQATPGQVHSRTTAASARLGEPIEWEIELTHPPAERYDFGPPLAEGPWRAEPLGCQRVDQPTGTTTTCRLRVALLALGPVDLPPLRLSVTTPEGPRVLDLPGPHLTGNGIIDPQVPAEKLELKPPAPPVPLLVPSWRLLWWALLAVGLGLLGWRLWRWWKARRRAGEAPPPAVPPEVRFAGRLDELEGERLGEQGRGREHWFRLSEAVRDYLGAVTGLNALDLTTEELLAALARQPDPRLPLEPVRAFCETSDLVKFARLTADGRACADGIAFGRVLLERTRPPAAPQPTAPPTASSPATPLSPLPSAPPPTPPPGAAA
jgi:hypothetical protein